MHKKNIKKQNFQDNTFGLNRFGKRNECLKNINITNCQVLVLHVNGTRGQKTSARSKVIKLIYIHSIFTWIWNCSVIKLIGLLEMSWFNLFFLFFFIDRQTEFWCFIALCHRSQTCVCEVLKALRCFHITYLVSQQMQGCVCCNEMKEWPDEASGVSTGGTVVL